MSNLARIIGMADAMAWVLFAFLAFSFIMAVRQGIAWFARVVLCGIAGVVAINVIAVKSHHPEVQRFAVTGAGLGFLIVPRRGRHIPARERRKAIAKYELTGKKYNSRKHDLDHRWAFAKGGSHTADNLRVLDKKANRSKGKKDPKLRDWF